MHSKFIHFQIILYLIAFKTEEKMVNFINENSDNYLLGISILNESIANFTYKLRFPHSLRNTDDFMP